MFISFPKLYKPDLNAYATNGMPHVLFCLEENYDFENKRCNLNKDKSQYPFGAYPEPHITIDHIYEYDSLKDLNLQKNEIILGEDDLGAYILRYSPITEEMKKVVEDMIPTFKITEENDLLLNSRRD